MNLMLCAGIHKRQGWVTMDGDPSTHPDICGIMPPLPLPISMVKWDRIEWIHGVGSLYPWDAEQVLRELRTVLKPDGVLILEQPNLEKCETPAWIYGDPTQHNPLIMNRWAYTPGSLIDLLEECGFSSAEVMTAQYHVPSRDFRIEARP
jgi:hypothetical protein